MSHTKIWKSVLAELELSVSKATFQTHFASSKLLSLEKDVATVGFPNPLMRTLVETRYYSLLKSVLDHHTKSNISLVFETMTKKETPQKDVGPLFSTGSQPAHNALEIAAKKLHIMRDLTFDNFAVSTSNQMAHAAATAVSKSLGTAYNPLFLYGGVGVGKTHLMHAVANQLLEKNTAAKIVYAMGEEFLNEIIEAIQTKTSRIFKQKYRTAKLLLVDDVQFIAGKQTAQEEFFHTFNAVHREGGQIILTSDRPPSEISRLEDRLRSRFEGGLLVDVALPDFELRVAIVNIKAQAQGLAISTETTHLIATHIKDARAIEGFLRRIRSETMTTKTPITTPFVASLLGVTSEDRSKEQPRARRVSPQELLEEVSRFFNIKTTQIKGSKRSRPIVRPRQIVMYLCKTELGLTYQDIGGLLGGRDHTTVLHGVEKIEDELSTNSRMKEAVESIKNNLWGRKE